jgi:hypothetical protein
MTDRFDQTYTESEQQLQAKMAQTYEAVAKKKAELRANVDLTTEEREAKFAEWYGRVGKELEDAASTFVGQWESQRDDLQRRVHEAVGEDFSNHLTRVAELDDSTLDTLMDTAVRTKQHGLEVAIAQIALSRRRDGVFRKFTERHPERAQALARLHSLPPTERLITRAQARATVPNASFEGLEPTQEDIERAETNKRMHEAARERYLRAPKIRRQVGSRITEVPDL